MTNVNLERDVPLSFQTVNLNGRNVGLIVVDEVNGFCTPGAGNLAPPAPDATIQSMVDNTVALVQRQVDNDLPVMFFLDTHEPGKPEDPYPPHCEEGTGEEELVDVLKPFAVDASVIEANGAARWNPNSKMYVLKKDCINGFVGATVMRNDDTSYNVITQWVNQYKLDTVLVVGICTSICVMQFVQTLLSARNHGMMPTLNDVVVFEPGCGDYDLPRDVAESIGLPAVAAHPRAIAHYMGLYFMMQSGAILANNLE